MTGHGSTVQSRPHGFAVEAASAGLRRPDPPQHRPAGAHGAPERPTSRQTQPSHCQGRACSQVQSSKVRAGMGSADQPRLLKAAASLCCIADKLSPTAQGRGPPHTGRRGCHSQSPVTMMPACRALQPRRSANGQPAATQGLPQGQTPSPGPERPIRTLTMTQQKRGHIELRSRS